MILHQKNLTGCLNTLLNEIDDLLVHEYATAKLRNSVYDEGVFSYIMGQSEAVSRLSKPIYEFVKKY